ncbi:TetR family transcriptional regulator, partial [Cellulomonas bogoriensis 69B4 = DSM 16987]
LEAATAPAATPEDVVRAWFTAAARSAAAGNHRLATALAGVRLPDEVRTSLLEGHRQTSAPLHRAVTDMGVPDPDAALTLVTAAVNVCITQVEAGAPPDLEARRAAAFTLGGLTALASRT